MTRRKKTSGGQAIVMVTLALIAMCGMMGLAVDLGWSFFVQKEAQAAADGAALAAVHEVYERKAGSVAGLACGTTATSAFCDDQNPPTSCKATTAPSNLYNGCLYAKDGDKFDYTATGYDVTLQANIPSGAVFDPVTWPKTPTGQSLNIKGIAYWATFRAAQTIPQLFSSVLGNRTGTVVAIATAAIVQETVPGSFYGMDQVNDCLATGSGLLSSISSLNNCGVDINVKNGGATCAGTAVSAVLCAPDGILLASSCNGGATSSPAGCKDPGSATQNWAGIAANSANTRVWSGPIIQIAGDGTVNTPSKFIPGQSNGATDTGDPFEHKPQPPILAPAGTGTCQLSGPISGGTAANPILLGPYQYFVKTGTSTFGAPITVANNAHIRFSPGGGCPGVATGSKMSGSFPSYILWGGLAMTGNVNTTTDFTDGQYVLAGTTNTSGFVLQSTNGTMSCSTCNAGSSAGVQFITTDDTYTGTTNGLTKPAALASTTFYQGAISLKGSTMNLSGFNSANGPSALADYNNVLLWQDRRNSTDTYYPDGTVATQGTVKTQSITAVPPAANHVTRTSPAFITDDGNATSKLVGVIHQPRGAWLDFQPGTGSGNSPLQVFTGAMITTGGGGNVALTLLPVTKPVTTYKTALIQ